MEAVSTQSRSGQKIVENGAKLFPQVRVGEEFGFALSCGQRGNHSGSSWAAG